MAQTNQSVFSVEKSMDALIGISEKFAKDKGNTIGILQEIQETFGYLPEDAVGWMSDRLGIPPSRFFGVATFYSQFHLHPRGRNIVTCCTGTACHVKGSGKILDAMKRELGLAEDQETTPDLEFTIERVNCVGACSIAPVVIVNKAVNGKANTQKILKQIKDLKG